MVDSRKHQDISIFRNFMADEYADMLQQEIKKFNEMQNPPKGKNFTFLF